MTLSILDFSLIVLITSPYLLGLTLSSCRAQAAHEPHSPNMEDLACMCETSKHVDDRKSEAHACREVLEEK